MNDLHDIGRTIYVITAVDYGPGCSGKAIVIGVFDKKDQAVEALHHDMEVWAETNNGTYDFDRKSAACTAYPDIHCEWQLHDQKVFW